MASIGANVAANMALLSSGDASRTPVAVSSNNSGSPDNPSQIRFAFDLVK